MPVESNERLKTVAIALTRRLTERTVRTMFSRHSMDGAIDSGGEEFHEEEMVNDAVNIARGDDTGCLSYEEFTAENVDVLYVKELLKQVETDMRDRCHHDFVQHLNKSVLDQSTAEERDAVLGIAAGVYAQGPDGLGEFRKCKCGQPECPYQRPLPAEI